MRRFEFKDGKSQKFWEIKVEECVVQLRWGRIDTAGQTKVKDLSDEAAALKEAEKQVSAKLKKGYREVLDGPLEPATDTPNPHSPSKDSTLNPLLQKLDSWVHENCPKLYREMGPGASPDGIERLEKWFDCELPSLYKEFLAWKAPHFYLYYPGSHFGSFQSRSVNEIIRDADSQTGLFCVDEGEELSEPELGRYWWRRAWLPMMCTASGDYLCLDLEGCFGGKVGQIIEHHDDIDVRDVVYDDFESYLRILTDSLSEEGVWEYDETRMHCEDLSSYNLIRRKSVNSELPVYGNDGTEDKTRVRIRWDEKEESDKKATNAGEIKVLKRIIREAQALFDAGSHEAVISLTQDHHGLPADERTREIWNRMAVLRIRSLTCQARGLEAYKLICLCKAEMTQAYLAEYWNWAFKRHELGSGEVADSVLKAVGLGLDQVTEHNLSTANWRYNFDNAKSTVLMEVEGETWQLDCHYTHPPSLQAVVAIPKSVITALTRAKTEYDFDEMDSVISRLSDAAQACADKGLLEMASRVLEKLDSIAPERAGEFPQIQRVEVTEATAGVFASW